MWTQDWRWGETYPFTYPLQCSVGVSKDAFDLKIWRRNSWSFGRVDKDCFGSLV